MSTSNSDKYPVHADVVPVDIISARHPGVANTRDTTKPIQAVPAMSADIEMSTLTIEPSSMVGDHQTADWKSALNTGDPKESETGNYILDGKPCRAQSTVVNNVVSRSPPSGSDHPQIVTVDLGQDLSLPAGEIGKYQLTDANFATRFRSNLSRWRTG